MRTLILRLALSVGALLLSMSALGDLPTVICANPVFPAFPLNGSFCPSTPPEPQKDPCPNCVGSPCYVATGAYTRTDIDLAVPGVGSSLTIARSGLSSRLSAGLGGVGSASSLVTRVYYGTYLFAAPSTYRKIADIVMPSGAVYRYLENTDGSFTAQGPRKDALVKNGDGTWDLTLERSRTRYHLLSNGNLSYIQDEFGNLLNYTYDGNGRLTRIADGSGSGRYVDVYYGANGMISGVQDSAGRQATYVYNTNGSLASVTNPLNQTTTYDYYTTSRFGVPLLKKITDHWGRVMVDVVYDGKDRVTSYTENGETYTIAYDYQNITNQIGKTDSSGNVYVSKSGPDMQVTNRTFPGGATTASTFNSDSSLQQATDEMGVRTAYAYTGSGSVSTVTQNYQGSPTIRWDYTYDATFPGKVTSVTGKNPGTGQTDTNWQSWSYDYYGTGTTAPGALYHVYRVKSDGNTETVATYEYDASGRVTKQTSATGGVTDYAYTGANLTSVTAPSNNDGGTRPVTSYAYDSLGRVTSVTDPNSKVTSYTYDALGRVLTVTLPPPTSGSQLVFTTTYSYDNYDAGTGFVFTHVTDPNGKVTKLGYDQFGRLRKTIDASNNATLYTYTKDLLTSITDANNNVTSYEYDTRKRLKKTIFPDAAYETYTYRNDGLLATKVDRKSQTITYSYDGLKRLTQKSYSTGGSITYTYTGQKLTQVADTSVSPNETHSYSYDSSYRVSSNTQASRGTIDYTYTSADQVATMAIQNGTTNTYAYYPDGSLNTIAWSPVSGNFKYTYTLPGQYASITFPNGQARDYTYDDQGRLTQLANALGGTNLATYAYGYDYNYTTSQYTMLGQRTSLTATVPNQGFSGSLTKYYYDSLYQLTKTDYPNVAPFNAEVHQWTYDNIGNRLTNTINANTSTYTYFKNGANPLNGQRLQNDGTNTYAYDSNGSATSRTGFTFGYDIENRTTSVGTGITASYKYDLQGRRSSKTVSGTTSTYLYDGLNPVQDVTGGTTTYVLNGPGIDEPLAVYASGTMSYLDVDALGSATLTNDTAGNVGLSTVFDAWGVNRSETGTRSHPFTYTAREVGEASLYFYRARFYQPGVGRFQQEDPLGFRESRNGYEYVRNGPIASKDPTGLEVVSACCTPFDQENFGKALGQVAGLHNGYAFQRPLPVAIPGLPSGSTTCDILGSDGSGKPTTVFKGLGEGKCLNACARLHEQVHRNECRRAGYLQLESSRGIGDGEAKAYLAEFKCLESAVANGWVSVNVDPFGRTNRRP